MDSNWRARLQADHLFAGLQRLSCLQTSFYCWRPRSSAPLRALRELHLMSYTDLDCELAALLAPVLPRLTKLEFWSCNTGSNAVMSLLHLSILY